MNSAVSNLRPHYSPIVKVKLFFLFHGARFLFFLFFSFSFPSLSSVSHSCRASNHFSALFLSLSLYSTFCLPLQRNPGRSIKASRSLSEWGFFFYYYYFLVCDLMVDSAVIVWIMDLAGVGIGVEGRSAWLCGFLFSFFFLSSYRFSLLLLTDGLWWWWIVDRGWDLLRLMDVVGLIWWIVAEIRFDFFSGISGGGWDLVWFWVLWCCLQISGGGCCCFFGFCGESVGFRRSSILGFVDVVVF